MAIFSTYKQAFIENNLSFRSWDEMTMYIYVFFCVSVLFIALYFEKKKRASKINKIENANWNRLIFFITLLLGFRGVNTGTDTIQYYRMYEDNLANLLFIEGGVEPGYILISHAIGCITPSVQMFMYVISSCIVWLVMATIRKYQSNLDVSIAVFMYVAVFYFQAFNMMRICISASILLYGIKYLEGRNFKMYNLLVLICTTIHMSSIIMLLPSISLWAYYKNRKLTIIGLVMLILTLGSLSMYFADYIQIARYANYLDVAKEEQGGAGLMLYFEYLPFIFVLYWIRKYRYSEDPWSAISVVFILTGFLFRLLAYYVPMAGRLYVYYMPLFLVILPYHINKISLAKPRYSMRISFFVFSYAVIRLHMYFSSYLASDGIMPYTFVWND